MLAEINDMMGLEIYTDKGLLLGSVNDIRIDTKTQRATGIFVERPNPLLIEGSRPVVVPYRWIGSVGDIVVLRYFPGFIKTGAPSVAKHVQLKEAAEAKLRAAEGKIFDLGRIAEKDLEEIEQRGLDRIKDVEHRGVEKAKSVEKKAEHLLHLD